jgi:hypothetical protein
MRHIHIDWPAVKAAPAGEHFASRLMNSIASVGALVLLAACLYRRLLHQDWPSDHALEVLWPYYLFGSGSILAWWLFRSSRTS